MDLVLRSPVAHARFRILDTGAVLETPGVHQILTAADVRELNALACQAPVKQPDGKHE